MCAPHLWNRCQGSGYQACLNHLPAEVSLNSPQYRDLFRRSCGKIVRTLIVHLFLLVRPLWTKGESKCETKYRYKTAHAFGIPRFRVHAGGTINAAILLASSL